jgi:hypothetical protein
MQADARQTGGGAQPGELIGIEPGVHRMPQLVSHHVTAALIRGHRYGPRCHSGRTISMEQLEKQLNDSEAKDDLAKSSCRRVRRGCSRGPQSQSV